MPNDAAQKASPLFSLGRVVATPGAVALDVDFSVFIHRHSCGDWGLVDEHDWAANDEAVRLGERIVSSYNVIYRSGNRTIWIVTEADRSSTCILLPDEY